MAMTMMKLHMIPISMKAERGTSIVQLKRKPKKPSSPDLVVEVDPVGEVGKIEAVADD